MAKKISQLSSGVTLTGAEYFEMVQSGTSKKTTAAEIAALASAASSGLTAWDMSTNSFPSGSIQWQRYYFTKSGSTTLVDKNGNPLPDECIATAKVTNASTSDPNQWIFENTIF
ncbi:MAG TPA: hypothetical protein VL443_18150 [Cyclobacteriaceae bacterium]|jgi:hypothetical protein|nr:hypothetical protein [Cyclobacteriaceae bacterium]